MAISRDDKIRLGKAQRYCKKHYIDYPCMECLHINDCTNRCKPWIVWAIRTIKQEKRDLINTLDHLKAMELGKKRTDEIIARCTDAMRYKRQKPRGRTISATRLQAEGEAKEKASEFINNLLADYEETEGTDELEDLDELDDLDDLDDLEETEDDYVD